MTPNTIIGRVPLLSSLRLRLLVGAGVIAVVALFAAGLAAFGVAEAARMIERSATAQQRIDLLSSLGARVSDFAVVAVETSDPSVPQTARTARLQGQAARVRTAFDQIGVSLQRAVAEVERDGEAAQMRRATRSLVVARMQAQFQALERAVLRGGPGLRAHLDGFATQFSPLLNEAVNDEQRDRDAARQAVTDLRGRMIGQAVAAAIGAALLTVLFYFVLVRPLVARIARVQEAASRIGAGQFDVALAAGGHSELDVLMGEIDRTAERLRTRQDAIDSDRARLEDIIGARTAELEDANQRLATIDSDRRRFFADIGHELRTPLTVILAESELGLGPGDAAPADAAESLHVIHARAKRLNRRIDDLLRVARSETGQIDLDTEPFDLAGPAADAIADMEPLAKRRSMTLVAALSPCPVIGDPDWSRQVIAGLIENALKHSKAGDTIEVACTPDGTQAELTVLDEGTGIDGDPAQVLNRFVRGGRESTGSGFGVGLALARWVMERQSGNIALVSPAPRSPTGSSADTSNGPDSGPGTLVRVRLPSNPADAKITKTAPETTER